MKGIKLDQLFLEKKSAKVISVFLAIITWFLIVIFFSPESEITINNISIDVNMEGTYAKTLGLTVVKGYDEPVSVVVKGKRAVVGGLTKNDFKAEISAATVRDAGEYWLDCNVSLIKPNNEIEIISDTVIPVALKFAKKISKKFEIIPIAKNITASEGFIKVETYCMPAAEVNIEGTQTDIERINKVVVSSDEKKKSSENLQLNGDIKLYDKNDIQLDNELYTFDQNNFTISVVIYQTKTVPITIDFLYLPEGISKDEIDYKISNPEVEIAASVDAIKNINNIIVGNIDLREVDKGSPVFNFDIPLPAGAMYVNNIDKVKVTVNTEDFKSKTFSVDDFRIMNSSNDFSVSITRKKLNGVKIIGKANIINLLTSADIIGVIDLMDFNIVAGDFTVPIAIKIPNKGLVWAVGNYTVSIKIKEKD